MCDFRFLVSADDLMDSPDFEGLCRLLGLQIPSAWLETEYEAIPRGQGDAYLFSSPEGCLFLDLFRDPTDQNEMILVGVRCKDACAAPVKATVESIYAQAPVKSAQMEEETGLLDPLLAPGRSIPGPCLRLHRFWPGRQQTPAPLPYGRAPPAGGSSRRAPAPARNC